MSTTIESKHSYRTYKPPVAGLRIMDTSRILWFSKLFADTERVRIGRTNRCDIRIRDHTVSCEHCELVRQVDGSFQLVDRGSKNGIWVSTKGKYGRYRPVSRLRLAVGMYIDIGDVTMIPVDQRGECPMTVKRYSELLRVAYAIYGSAAGAARHIGRRSRQVISNVVVGFGKADRA